MLNLRHSQGLKNTKSKRNFLRFRGNTVKTFLRSNQFPSLTSSEIQLDPDNSNSGNLKSPLIRSNNRAPWIALLLIFTSLIRTPVYSNHFPLPSGLRINGVQLYGLLSPVKSLITPTSSSDYRLLTTPEVATDGREMNEGFLCFHLYLKATIIEFGVRR